VIGIQIFILYNPRISFKVITIYALLEFEFFSALLHYPIVCPQFVQGIIKIYLIEKIIVRDKELAFQCPEFFAVFV